ncbi:MAG TPA: shikimate kinase [Candidatus Binatia bacterium]|nr:shikimate kinase [Candidatus Binatia bacterium]
MRVVLTGFMGTGKTVVGQRVAERLARPFLDTDAIVERRAGRTVREIFARDGEDRFRELEHEAVAEACATPDAVVATGGGALVDDRNFSALARDALMVCLTAEPGVIARRVRATAADRPLLKGRLGLTARIRELLAARAAVYARIPCAVDTSARTVEQVADEIVAALANAERGTARERRRPGGPASTPAPAPRVAAGRAPGRAATR